MNFFEVKNVTKDFDGIKAVDDLSFDLKEGEITALIGPNGAGKTTVFNIISGYTRPDRGEILFNGRPIAHASPHVIARLGIGRTFQNIRLFPQMSVLENVMLALESPHGDQLATVLTLRRRVASEELENRRKALEILESVGVADKCEAMGSELSHGQRRLVEIARTLALNPRLILLDEPTAGLFPEMIRAVSGIIRRLKAEGKTILFIEHDMNVVMDISDRIIVLNHGRKIADGAPAQIQNDDKVIAAYLGRRPTRAA